VPHPDLSRVTALLCDADGNLFPSEGPAFEASAGVTNRFLDDLGSPDRHTPDELRAVALGRNFRSLAGDLARAHGVDLDEDVLASWVAEEASVVTAHLSGVLAPDPVVRDALVRLASDVELSLVSSSALTRLDACLVASELDDLFPPERRFSAQDSLPSPTSKPDPAVYSLALEELGLDGHEAIAVEDAVSGVVSAVRAGIPVLGNLVHVPYAERDQQRAALSEAGAFAVVDDWDGVVDLVLGREAVA
jgi:beta-phosphoglucomutase-like phosphatase (HAD superfamily)